MAAASDLTVRPERHADDEPTTRPLTKLQRAIEIGRILYRNDFFGMLRRVAVAERSLTVMGEPEMHLPDDLPRKVRRLLEELGPTFVKMGQLLGTRPDIVPKAFVDEFKNLYDKTTPSPFPQIRDVIERELGRPLDDMFAEFDEVAVASASIGQVHFAVLKTGEKVAVKVQHPEIEERILTDFRIMEPIVRFVENLFAASRIWQPREHLLELHAMLIRELDYRYEARNHQRVWASFKDDPAVKIPRIYWDYSAKRVLVLERIEAVKLSDFDNPQLKALDGKRLARIITHAMAKQIFEDRLFHADPSPGNLMAIDSNTVAFLDFGAVGKVTKRRANKILDLLQGFLRGDVEAVSATLFDICNVYGEVDRAAFTRDVERIMDYHERERASPADPVVLEMVIQAARRHNMLLPADFLLITRALFQFEGLCKKLDPEYELVEVLQPFVVDYVRRETFGIGRESHVMMDAAHQGFDFLRNLPGRVNSFARKIEQNELRFKVDVAGAREEAAREERRTYRTTLTTLVAAVLIGVALVIGFGRTQDLLTFFVAAVLFGLLWAFAMLYLSDT